MELASMQKKGEISSALLMELRTGGHHTNQQVFMGRFKKAEIGMGFA